MERKVQRIINEIENNSNKTNKCFFEICDEVSKVLESDCDKSLKEKLLYYTDYIFMMRDTLIEMQKSNSTIW